MGRGQGGREHINQSIDQGRSVRCECTIYSWVGIVDPSKQGGSWISACDSDPGTLNHLGEDDDDADAMHGCFWVWILFGKQAPMFPAILNRPLPLDVSLGLTNRRIFHNPFASGGN